MRKIQLSAFISVLPGAECGDGIPEGEKGEIVCSSAYVDGPTLDGVIGEAVEALRDAVRDARTGNAPATPCDGPRPRMCPMGLRQMRPLAEREEMGEFAYAFLSRALARFEKRFDIDWRAVSHMDAEALGVPEWLVEGMRYECAKDISSLPTFAALLDGFRDRIAPFFCGLAPSRALVPEWLVEGMRYECAKDISSLPTFAALLDGFRDRIAPFFCGLAPSRALVLRLLAKAYFADMLDTLPLLDHGSGSDSLDDWCFHQDCPCGIAHVFDDAGHTHYLCPRFSDF